MNLICFPHYTCGGLLCDILNNTFSPIGKNKGINSIKHNYGKIGDTDTVLTEFDLAKFNSIFSQQNRSSTDWVGTHCWPGKIDLTMFDRVLVITTTTFRSKIYRWIRAYRHYYLESLPWTSVVGLSRIDKERETAKNYLEPFLPIFQSNVVNIEFAEIAEMNSEFYKITSGLPVDRHMNRWKEINNFLYDEKIWDSDPVKRYYEAEYEVNLQKYYVYE
jgi:hypothetical protein